MSGGAPSERFRGASLPVVTAGDPLPTAGVIMAVKNLAAKVCGDRAAACAWPDLAAARGWIDLIPIVALAALSDLCVGVHLSRLARCVGLDPLDGPDALAGRRAEPIGGAIADAASDVVIAVRRRVGR